MHIFGIVIFIGILAWIIIDFKISDRELRRCPKCNQIIKKKFSWIASKKPITIPDSKGQKFNATIYKCPNCGFGWNNTYEYNENSP